MSDFFWFSDAQWARIEPLLPRHIRGKGRVDDRRMLSGIVLEAVIVVALLAVFIVAVAASQIAPERAVTRSG